MIEQSNQDEVPKIEKNYDYERYLVLSYPKPEKLHSHKEQPNVKEHETQTDSNQNEHEPAKPELDSAIQEKLSELLDNANGCARLDVWTRRLEMAAAHLEWPYKYVKGRLLSLQDDRNPDRNFDGGRHPEQKHVTAGLYEAWLQILEDVREPILRMIPDDFGKNVAKNLGSRATYEPGY